MPFPWSLLVGFVLLAVGVGLAVAGVVVPDGEQLLDVGLPIVGAGLGALTGKGVDAVQARRATPPG